uniref:Uncharacterized protein n=1 Tax=Oryza meridionalis TaxID=40149 RepID=A0A0E0DM09_9ORYZ
MVARKKSPPPWKTKGEAGSSAAGSQQPRGGGVAEKAKKKKKETPLPPLLPPGTAVEVLRNGAWAGGGTVTIRNDRTYMVRLAGGMTVLATRRRVRPSPPPATADVSPEPDKVAGD